MKRSLFILVLLLLVTSVVFVFSQEIIPASVRDNQYYNESLRLNNLARLAFSDGDYEASTRYAEEAIRHAYLSDEYVLAQIKIVETDRAIDSARQRLDYAASVNAASRYPTEYNRAQAAYNDARSFRLAEDWDGAIDAANRVIVALSGIDYSTLAATTTNPAPATTTTTTPAAVVQPTPPPAPATTPTPTPSTTPTVTPPPVTTTQVSLPAQYTVRTWESVRDCLWNIAGYPWAYNDPYKWTVLYEANRSRMPEPNNADLIEPGFILNIPSIGGEYRQGMWDASRTYPSF